MKAVSFFFVALSIALCSQNFEPKFGLTHEKAILHYKLAGDPEEVQQLDDGSNKYWYSESTEILHRRMGFVFNNGELVDIDFIERHNVNFDKIWSITNKKIQFWKNKYGKPIYLVNDISAGQIEIPEKSFSKKTVQNYLDQYRSVIIECDSKDVHISSVLFTDMEYGGYAVREGYTAKKYWDKINK